MNHSKLGILSCLTLSFSWPDCQRRIGIWVLEYPRWNTAFAGSPSLLLSKSANCFSQYCHSWNRGWCRRRKSPDSAFFYIIGFPFPFATSSFSPFEPTASRSQPSPGSFAGACPSCTTFGGRRTRPSNEKGAGKAWTADTPENWLWPQGSEWENGWETPPKIEKGGLVLIVRGMLPS